MDDRDPVWELQYLASQASEAWAWRVACPYCKAEVGCPCNLMVAGKPPMGIRHVPHQSRLNAAREDLG